MIKMETIILLLGIMILAYGGMLLLYYRSRMLEREKKVSDFMLKGIMNFRRGNLDKALIFFNRAYEYSIENDDRNEMAEAMYNIGIIYKEKGENESAVEYLNGARDIYKELQDNEGSENAILAVHSIKDN